MSEPGDFEIAADKPIGVMRSMTGAENMPAPFNSSGDPVRKAGAVIQQGGVQIAENLGNPVGNSDDEVARVPLTDGVVVLDGMDTPFSVYIVGYDQHDSYAYLGSTGTKIVNPLPQ